MRHAICYICQPRQTTSADLLATIEESYYPKKRVMIAGPERVNVCRIIASCSWKDTTSQSQRLCLRLTTSVITRGPSTSWQRSCSLATTAPPPPMCSCGCFMTRGCCCGCSPRTLTAWSIWLACPRRRLWLLMATLTVSEGQTGTGAIGGEGCLQPF